MTPIVISWTVIGSVSFSKVRIEVSTSFDTGYTLLTEVDYGLGTYTDLAGEDFLFYRLVGKDSVTGLYAEPSLGKKRLVLDACRLYGYLRQANGSPLQGVAIRFSPNVPPAADPSLRAYIETEPVTALTGADGYFTTRLIQATTVVVNCPEAGILKRRMVVPSTAAADFTFQSLL